MSWQEDLHELDTALAGGQISADDYRRRRDELLAKASGGAPGQDAQGPAAGQTSTPPPGSAQPGTPPPSTPPPGTPKPNQGYFPPPFRWEAKPPQQQQQPAGGTDETQTMRPVEPDADRTQVVPGSPATGDRTQAIPGRPGDRTQVVQQGFGQQPGGYNAQPQYYTDGPGWPGQGQESMPWDGAEFPPLGPTGSWAVKQGPEVFENGSGGKGKRIIAIVAAVVVLVLVGGGIYFFTSGHSGGTNQAQGGHPTRSTTTKPVPKPTPANPGEPLIDQVPPVVGTLHQRSAVLSVSAALKRPIIDQTMADILDQAGVQQMAWRDGSKAADQDGPTPDYFSVTVFPVSTAHGADSLAQQIQHYQENNGLTQVKPSVPGVPSTIVFQIHTAPSVTIYRGLWVCGNDVIWVNVDQQPTTNEQALTTSFQREIVSLTQSFPAQ